MDKKKILKQQIFIVDSLLMQVLKLEKKVAALEQQCSQNYEIRKTSDKTKTYSEQKPPAKPPVVNRPVAKKPPAKPPMSKPKIVKPVVKSKPQVAKKPALKLSAADLKKLKLTKLEGVGPQIEKYLIANKIDDMVKLSKKNVTKLTKTFILELPALKSFTYQMKYDKLEMIIDEAKFMIKKITK